MLQLEAWSHASSHFISFVTKVLGLYVIWMLFVAALGSVTGRCACGYVLSSIHRCTLSGLICCCKQLPGAMALMRSDLLLLRLERVDILLQKSGRFPKWVVSLSEVSHCKDP